METKILHGNCLEVLATLPDNSIDSIVTDPPYGLEFMGKDWDAPWKNSEVVEITDEKTNGVFHTKGFSHGIRFSRGLQEMMAFQVWCEQWARECLRVLKPGGHMLAFGGTRTYHRMACAIEEAGFEIRDSIHWIYGSGFPKSMDISKAIDKQAGHVRSDRIVADPGTNKVFQPTQHVIDAGTPVTDEAKQWEGWGTALKPAHEPIVMARKPVEGTIADNVIRHGTGAINIDDSRIATDGENFDNLKGRPVQKLATRRKNETDDEYQARIANNPGQQKALQKLKEKGRFPSNVIFDEDAAEELDARASGHESIVMARKPVEGTVADNVIAYGTGALNIEETRIPSNDGFEKAWDKPVRTNIGASGGNYISNGVMHTIDRSSKKPSGRFPANVLFDEDAARELDEQVGDLAPATGGTRKKNRTPFSTGDGETEEVHIFGDSGGPSRFFYVAKPSKKERNAGVEHLEEQQTTGGGGPSSAHGSIKARQQNFHPTVKPIELMRYLCRMVTPPGGTVLDPFAGSGTTLVAATLEGFNSVGIEMTEEYLPIIEGRVEWAKSQDTKKPKKAAKKKSKVKIKVKKRDVPSLF